MFVSFPTCRLFLLLPAARVVAESVVCSYSTSQRDIKFIPLCRPRKRRAAYTATHSVARRPRPLLLPPPLQSDGGVAVGELRGARARPSRVIETGPARPGRRPWLRRGSATVKSTATGQPAQVGDTRAHCLRCSRCFAGLALPYLPTNLDANSSTCLQAALEMGEARTRPRGVSSGGGGARGS